MKRKLVFIILTAAILALACFLRAKDLATLTTPYWEEAALAYDSYSLLKTGKDHHGNAWPMVAFESFGDYKASFYFYAALPFIKLFGLNVLAIRLPSFLAGLALVIGTAILTLQLAQLISKKKLSQKSRQLLFLITLFLMSISPWAINFSRAAWESNLATSLLIWGINLFLIFQRLEKKQNWYCLPLAILLLILASYTYHSQKITAPLVGLSLLIFYFLDLKKRSLPLSRWVLINLIGSLLLGFLLFLPLWKSSQNITGQQRFAETSIFSDLELIKYSNDKRAEHQNALWARAYYHRYLLFGKKIILNMADHWQFDYLLLSGDGNPRHNTQITGQVYHLELIFLLFGLIYLLTQASLYALWPIVFLVFALLPSALTANTPHALRSLAAMPMMVMLMALGLWQLIVRAKSKNLQRLVILALAFYYLIEVTVFWHFYQNSYFKNYANSWQDGYGELMLGLGQLDDGEKKIYVSREQGRPAIFAWFYNQTDPRKVQAINQSAKKDQGEFLTFYNWSFVNQVSEVVEPGLVAASPAFLTNLNGQQTIIDQIYDHSGQLIWQLVDYQP